MNCSCVGPSPLLAPLPQILISPASLHTNQADHHKAIERVMDRMGGKYNSLHKQDKPSLLEQDHDSPKVFYEGQMRSTPKLLLLCVLVVGRGTTNIHIYVYVYQEMCLYCFPIRIYHKPGVPRLMDRQNPAHCQQRKVHLKHKRFKIKMGVRGAGFLALLGSSLFLGSALSWEASKEEKNLFGAGTVLYVSLWSFLVWP